MPCQFASALRAITSAHRAAIPGLRIKGPAYVVNPLIVSVTITLVAKGLTLDEGDCYPPGRLYADQHARPFGWTLGTPARCLETRISETACLCDSYAPLQLTHLM